MGWAESDVFVMAVQFEGSVRIALVRLEARRRPFRFISVWVVWILLGSVLYCCRLSSPTVRNLSG